MDSLDKLTSVLSKLPGVGRRSAERMALKLARDPEGLLKNLALALAETGANIRCCSLCGSITYVKEDPCKLCTSPKRDDKVLCVVEDPGDITSIERSQGFKGRYHALMGKVSPMKGEGPRDIRVRALMDRVKKEGFEEVILALSTDVEGEATASFLSDLLKKENLKVTRLAFGLPAGSGISYSDPITLAKAIKGRTSE